jgi:hypothetical protein
VARKTFADADDSEGASPNCLVLDDSDASLDQRLAHRSRSRPMIVVAKYRYDPQRSA